MKMNWKIENDHLVKTFKRKNFVACVELLQQVMVYAELMNHHPDVEIKGYNKITFKLRTHDANAITKKDHELAEKIDHLIAGDTA